MAARLLLRGVLTVASALAVCSSVFVPVRAQDELEFFAAFIDANGMPVTDVTASELAVIESGVRGEITRIARIERPLDVTLLIDNGAGLGPALADIRSGVKGFFAALPLDAQVSLLSMAPQPRWVLRPVIGPRSAAAAADRLVPDESFSRFLDALVEAGDRIREQSRDRYPVIVVVGSTNPDGSGGVRERNFGRLRQRVLDYGAVVHAAVLTTSARFANGPIPGAIASDAQQLIGSELATLTGGQYEQIASSSRIATLLPELGARIAVESPRYRIWVRRPPGAKGAVGAMGFAIARPGVVVRASFVPLGR